MFRTLLFAYRKNTRFDKIFISLTNPSGYQNHLFLFILHFTTFLLKRELDFDFVSIRGFIRWRTGGYDIVIWASPNQGWKKEDGKKAI